MADIKAYRQMLKRLGIEDYQVLRFQRMLGRDIVQLVYRIFATLGCLVLVGFVSPIRPYRASSLTVPSRWLSGTTANESEGRYKICCICVRQ
jgi:hypothetical protein